MLHKSIFIAAAITLSSATIPEEKIPENWYAFKKSKQREDAALVSKISKEEWWSSCARFGKLRRAGKENREFVAYREFLIYGDMLNGKDLMNVDTRKITIGMSACGVFASIGLPSSSNRTTTARGTRQQLIFTNPRRYIYVEDSPSSSTGTVTAIQD